MNLYIKLLAVYINYLDCISCLLNRFHDISIILKNKKYSIMYNLY